MTHLPEIGPQNPVSGLLVSGLRVWYAVWYRNFSGTSYWYLKGHALAYFRIRHGTAFWYGFSMPIPGICVSRV